MMVVDIASTFRFSLTVTWSLKRFSSTIENMFKDFTKRYSISHFACSQFSMLNINGI